MRRVCCIALLAASLSAEAWASSHREAPGITEIPKVDSTDMYAFMSYEPGKSGMVTLIADYFPFQDPFGGPNYFNLDSDARYRVLVDNTGDGVEDMAFQFRCVTTYKDIKLPVGGQQVSVPVINVGPISGPAANEPSLNRVETCSMAVARGRISDTTRWLSVTNAAGGSQNFEKPVDNIGEKSIADYDAYSRQFIYNIRVPGCTGDARLFVGQRKEPFAVNVGEIFDLVNISDPLGDRDAEPSALADKNITSFVMEMPASCLTRNASSPVIGVWQTALLPLAQVPRDGFSPVIVPLGREPKSDLGETKRRRAEQYVQVSRVGMPLVNEIVIGLKDKNAFNASSPQGDAALAQYITNPTLPEILEILFGSAGVRAPNNFPRKDLVAAFATGITGLNFLSDGRPHEMIRLNTSVAATPAGSQSSLGVLGGDNAGFPNGRRPGDDVTDIELRVAMGVLCHALPGVYCNPADAPSGNLPFTDGTLQDPSQFDAFFPYLRSPLPGSPNGPNGVEHRHDDLP